MKVTIMDSTLNDYKVIEKIINNLSVKNTVTYLKLKEKNIAYCTGCWNCWTKTPGECVHKDDTVEMLTSVVNADAVIYITENSLGTMTSLMKKALDKHIPLVHPYITVVKGESRHWDRYDQLPKMANIFIDENKNKDDYKLFDKHFQRAMLNTKAYYIGSDMITGKEGDINELNTIKWFS